MKTVLFYGNDGKFDRADFNKFARDLEAEKLTSGVYYIPSENVTILHKTHPTYFNSELIVYGKKKGRNTIEKLFDEIQSRMKFDEEGNRIN